MKLKTLKDFEGINLNPAEIELLKQEAIKWIKGLKQGASDHLNYKIGNPKDAAKIIIDNFQIINWIEHFFNITEEDLK